MRKAYQTDLSDDEWSYIEPHLPIPNDYRASQDAQYP